MKNRSKIILRNLLLILGIIILLCSLIYFFIGENIKTNLIQENTTQVLSKKKIVKPKENYHEDNQNHFNEIKDVNLAIAYSGKYSSNPIGIISIENQGNKIIDLPLFQDMTNKNMSAGACLMFSNRLPGSNNNVFIAGHHMENDNVLFGKLPETEVGDKIIIKTYDKTYQYLVNTKETVNQSDLGVTANTNQPTITLMTCASGTPGTPYRCIIKGNLISSQDNH